MLSFLIRLMTQFEREHGYRPNRLYLNPAHFQQLGAQLAEIHGLAPMARFLGMEIILDAQYLHPRLGWSDLAGIRAAAG